MNLKNKKFNRNCPCCAEFINQGIFYHYRKKRCLAQSTNFVIFPAVGSIIYPYLIVEPKFHVNSFSKINKPHLLEVEDLINQFIRSTNNKYRIIIAEHGENFKTLEHAHLHLILFHNNELEMQYWDELNLNSQFNDDGKSIHDFFLLIENFKDETEYTLIWSKKRYSIIGFNSNNIKPVLRSQYIRRILGDIVNKPWNWLTYIGIENIEKTYNNFKMEELII
jgi:diadenosine tetraphosphate (Ap4A) HIT family hydrolase